MNPATPPISIAANFLCGTVRFNCNFRVRSVTYGLARLLAQQRGELVGVLCESVGELQQKLLPLLNGGVSPGGERLLGGSDSVVEVLFGSNGDVPELRACCGVHAMVNVIAAALLAVDDVVKLVELEGGDLGWRHD
jgi:hypothetical protein